jgi:hypothetical protein
MKTDSNEPNDSSRWILALKLFSILVVLLLWADAIHSVYRRITAA